MEHETKRPNPATIAKYPMVFIAYLLPKIGFEKDPPKFGLSGAETVETTDAHLVVFRANARNLFSGIFLLGERKIMKQLLWRKRPISR